MPERSTEEHREQALAFIKEIEGSYPANKLNELAEALYTFSELCLWNMDIAIKHWEEAVRVWAVVEAVRQNGFPRELQM